MVRRSRKGKHRPTCNLRFINNVIVVLPFGDLRVRIDGVRRHVNQSDRTEVFVDVDSLGSHHSRHLRIARIFRSDDLPRHKAEAREALADKLKAALRTINGHAADNFILRNSRRIELFGRKRQRCANRNLEAVLVLLRRNDQIAFIVEGRDEVRAFLVCRNVLRDFQGRQDDAWLGNRCRARLRVKRHRLCRRRLLVLRRIKHVNNDDRCDAKESELRINRLTQCEVVLFQTARAVLYWRHVAKGSDSLIVRIAKRRAVDVGRIGHIDRSSPDNERNGRLNLHRRQDRSRHFGDFYPVVVCHLMTSLEFIFELMHIGV